MPNSVYNPLLAVPVRAGSIVQNRRIRPRSAQGWFIWICWHFVNATGHIRGRWQQAKKQHNMKVLSISLVIILSLNCYSQTQIEMNKDAKEYYQKADNELNDIYRQILAEYKSDTTFLNNLKASQRIWIAFRDAELKVKYPEVDPRFYGSVYPMCVSNYLEKLTRERINTLKEWIDGIEEGDACIGSAKFKGQ